MVTEAIPAFIEIKISQHHRYLFGGSYNKDSKVLWSMLGPPISGNYHGELINKRILRTPTTHNRILQL